MKSLHSFTNRLIAVAALFAAWGFVLVASAQTQPGRAEVRTVKGTVTYSTNGAPAQFLKVGAVLSSGTLIKTGPASSVDLFLGTSAGTVRVAENSTLSLDQLTLTDTGAETAVEVQLYLPDGDMYFNVNKLSKASRYEIKMPTGVAGIRGTKGRFSSRPADGLRPPVILVQGQVIFIHTLAAGPMETHIMTAPPTVYFNPTDGVQAAPDEMAQEVEQQLQEMEQGARAAKAPAPLLPKSLPSEPIMSPGAGS